MARESIAKVPKQTAAKQPNSFSSFFRRASSILRQPLTLVYARSRTVFTRQRTLRQSLTRVKDQLPDTLIAYVVYRITCSCGKAYIGETRSRLYRPEKSAVMEHAWCNDHRIEWDTVEIVDTASKKMELLVKQAIHIQ